MYEEDGTQIRKGEEGKRKAGEFHSRWFLHRLQVTYLLAKLIR
jgi:hypothetical protein